jgi:hypothetical protein
MRTARGNSAGAEICIRNQFIDHDTEDPREAMQILGRRFTITALPADDERVVTAEAYCESAQRKAPAKPEAAQSSSQEFAARRRGRLLPPIEEGWRRARLPERPRHDHRSATLAMS